MFARKLIQHFQNDVDLLSSEFMQKIKRSDNCGELLLRVPIDDQRESTREIYRHLMDWLQGEQVKNEEYYIALGRRRAQQGIPWHELFAVICAAREYFWDYVERETLLDVPADFWGGVKLLRSLNACFDNVVYFVSIGYHKAGAQENTPAGVSVERANTN
jgi:hypothetical protein